MKKLRTNYSQKHKVIQTILIPMFALLISVSAFGQRGAKIQERIKAQKVAFITERLDLSADEAQQFWPIYNTYEDKTESIRQNDLKDVRQAMKRGNLSDNEAQDILSKFMAAEDKLHQAKKDLVSDLKKVLPPQKIIALKAAEEAFKQKLIQIMRQQKEKMQQRRQNRN